MSSMVDKTLRLLVNQLEERVLQLQESLANGIATDYAEYKEKCGEVKGLLTARLNILDLRTQIEEADD